MTDPSDPTAAESPGRRPFAPVQALLMLSAAFLAVAWWMPLKSSPLTVTFTRGGAVIEARDGTRAEVSAGSTVGPGDRLVVPEGASLNLAAPDGHAVTVSDSTVLTITGSRESYLGGKARIRLDVEQGNIRVTGSPRPRTSLNVGLPNGVAGVRGTVFSARVGTGQDLVSVHQGSVGVSNAAGPDVDLTPGQGVLISPTGLLVRDLPTAPSLLSPATGTLVSAEGMALSWIPVDGAVGYVVEIARDVAFLQIMARVLSDSTSAAIPALDEDIPAQVRVYAVSADGLEGPASVERTLHIRLRRTRGAALLEQGDAAASIAELEAALPNYATDVELLKDLGWALYLESRYPEARDVYERARALEPADEEMLLELGRVYFWMEEYGQAESAYQQVLGASPDDPDALWGLGDTYRMTGRTEEAVSLVERALRLQPDHPYAGETLRRLRDGG